MIPRRIVKQNISFFQETVFKTFSEKTILGILSERAATVRKSLLILPVMIAEQESEHDVQDSLKAGKMYLKGD